MCIYIYIYILERTFLQETKHFFLFFCLKEQLKKKRKFMGGFVNKGFYFKILKFFIFF